MGDARRRKLAGSGPVPPIERIVPVPRPRRIGIMGGSTLAMMTTLLMNSNFGNKTNR